MNVCVCGRAVLESQKYCSHACEIADSMEDRKKPIFCASMCTPGMSKHLGVVIGTMEALRKYAQAHHEIDCAGSVSEQFPDDQSFPCRNVIVARPGIQAGTEVAVCWDDEFSETYTYATV
jgi:predicted nucleic acid-binding Zn ribbon protein